MALEIVIPLRNPTDVLQSSIDSLVAQTDRDFSVLLSDNHSTSGDEFITEALEKLRTAGIAVEKIQPPAELGRVEHWNWLHYQATADWLKPLFAGDWLDVGYIATLRAAITQEPQCSYIFCGYHYYRGEETMMVQSHWSGRFFTPAEMQDVVLRYGMNFGPPSAAAYRREIFLKAGGYDPTLPICADSLLFCQLAARHGVYGIPKAYLHFLIHAARFSHMLPEKERETFREKLRYCATLGLNAWHERWRFPFLGYLRLFAREIWHHLKVK
jgi:glycosyltransferase involved in cell wall biosynthesis